MVGGNDPLIITEVCWATIMKLVAECDMEPRGHLQKNPVIDPQTMDLDSFEHLSGEDGRRLVAENYSKHD